MRAWADIITAFTGAYFPSFSEGLSLRGHQLLRRRPVCCYFPSFSEGLSLRGHVEVERAGRSIWRFPFLFGGTFIEGAQLSIHSFKRGISLPFRRDFH